jgi:hypothetical protein
MRRPDQTRLRRRAGGAAFAGIMAAATALWAAPAGSEEHPPDGAEVHLEAEAHIEAEADLEGEARIEVHAEGEASAADQARGEGEVRGGEEATVEPMPTVPLTHAAGEAIISVRHDCARSLVTIESSKDISNVVLRYDDGDVKIESGLSGTSAALAVDAQRVLVAVFVKAGANTSAEGPGYGEMFPLEACSSVSSDTDVETPAVTHQPSPSDVDAWTRASGAAGTAGEVGAGVEASGGAGTAGEVGAGVEASGGAGTAGEVEAGVETSDRRTASARAPLAAGDATIAAPASRTQLPVTGVSSWTLGGLGFAMTALGLGVVWAADRSQRPEPRHPKRP